MAARRERSHPARLGQREGLKITLNDSVVRVAVRCGDDVAAQLQRRGKGRLLAIPPRQRLRPLGIGAGILPAAGAQVGLACRQEQIKPSVRRPLAIHGGPERVIEDCDRFDRSAAPRIDQDEARGEDGIHRPNLLFTAQLKHSLQHFRGSSSSPCSVRS